MVTNEETGTAAGNGSAFALRGLWRDYRTALGLRRRTALADVDLELARGGSLGLIGPNGSGKSTLLRAIAGVERPSRGSVEVLGGTPRDAGVRARIGYLPEDSPFPRELSAEAALALCGSLRGLAGADLRRRVRGRLEQVGLGTHRRVALGRFSRGMLRRFGLAQAVLHAPDLLLLDEPTAGLDAPGLGVLEELSDETRARGAAVVIASHVPADLQRWCDRLAVLASGRLVAVGDPQELLGTPGRLCLDVEGLDSDGARALERTVRERGGRIVPRGPATGSLLELYRRHGAAPERRA